MKKKMIDRCGRKIDYLRISVTDRCNLRCIYCMPEDGIRLTEREKILQEPEILRICRVMSEASPAHQSVLPSPHLFYLLSLLYRKHGSGSFPDPVHNRSHISESEADDTWESVQMFFSRP